MITSPYAADLAGQMDRYLGARYGWTSTLLTHNTPDLLQELLVAGRQVANSVLSSSSFDEFKVQVTRQFYQDPGIGDAQARNVLGAMLPKNADEFGPLSHKFRAMESAIPGLRAAYLENWKLEFSDPGYAAANAVGSVISSDRSAALLTAFLLGLGIDSSYLVRWVDYRLLFDPSSLDLLQFTDEIIDLHTNGQSRVEIMAISDRSSSPDARPTSGWLSSQKVREWLTVNGFEPPSTIHGGILFSSYQWEIYSSLRAVGTSLKKIARRGHLKAGKSVSFYPDAWIKGVRRPQKIPSSSHAYTLLPGYQLESPSLLTPPSNNRLEVAVEFIEAATTIDGPGAVGMLWAALETLLAAPGDANKMNVVARGADIGLIAFIRSALWGALGIATNKKAEPLAMALAAVPSADRLGRLEVALQLAEYETLGLVGSRIHLRHVARLLDPTYVKDLRMNFRSALSGLYRQRNLVLHGGITDGPLIPGYLRVGFPLVSAIVNRYARAVESSFIDPQVFAFESTASIEKYLLRGSSVFGFLS
jgi:hypothetical protein